MNKNWPIKGSGGEHYRWPRSRRQEAILTNILINITGRSSTRAHDPHRACFAKLPIDLQMIADV